MTTNPTPPTGQDPQKDQATDTGREEQRPDQPLKQIAETQDRAREEAEDDKTN